MAALKSWFEPRLKACLPTCEFCETRGAWLCTLHKLGRTLFTSALERNRPQLQLTVNAVMKLGSDTWRWVYNRVACFTVSIFEIIPNLACTLWKSFAFDSSLPLKILFCFFTSDQNASHSGQISLHLQPAWFVQDLARYPVLHLRSGIDWAVLNVFMETRMHTGNFRSLHESTRQGLVWKDNEESHRWGARRRLAGDDWGNSIPGWLFEVCIRLLHVGFVLPRSNEYECRRGYVELLFGVLIISYCLLFRDAPEATGDEPDDADFETPKVYELVRRQFINNLSGSPCCRLHSTFMLLAARV